MSLSLIFVLFLSIIIPNVSAAECRLNAELINQDPYPGVPGEYTEVLFQISGISSCDNGVKAELILDYPFSLDSGNPIRTLTSQTFAGSGVNSNWNILYKLRIDPNAIEGTHEVELRYKDRLDNNPDNFFFKKFDIEVQEVRTDFEVHVQNYNIKQRLVTFEILNTGNQDIEALTVEIPKQDNIDIKGSNRNIVGDLDSNEFTTADFEATPKEGEINLKLYYTDSIDERRMLEKTVYYDPSYFVDSLENQQANNSGSYIAFIIIAVLVALFFWRRHKKKKHKKKHKEFNI